VLSAYLAGDSQICSMVHVPTPDEEDGKRVHREREYLVQERTRIENRIRGAPRAIRVDNGPEFISKALDRWAYENSVKLDFSRPGKPTDNAFVESFNGRSGTNASIPIGSCHWTMPGARSRRGDGTIMSAVLTPRLVG